MKQEFFSYDPEEGMTIHETLESAKGHAEFNLAGERDFARGDEWNMYTNEICYGRVIGRAVERRIDENTIDFDMKEV